MRRATRGLGRGDVPGLIAILDRQLGETIAACRLARRVAEGELEPGAAHEQIAEIEHRGDLLRAELVTRLAGVLVPPIDREDLFRLSRSIDDVLDNLRDFVREWDLYKIEPADGFVDLLDSTECGVSDLKLAVKTIAAIPRRRVRPRCCPRSRPTTSAACTTSSWAGCSAVSSAWTSSSVASSCDASTWSVCA